MACVLNETGAPVGMQQRLMRHSNVAKTINVYVEGTLRAKQKAKSKLYNWSSIGKHRMLSRKQWRVDQLWACVG